MAPKPALYDLRLRPAGFDFFIWLVSVQVQGATEIVINPEFPSRDSPRYTNRWSPQQLRERYESIIKPGASLAALPSREGKDGVDFGTHRPRELWPLLGGKWRRLQQPFCGVGVWPEYTVTLRSTNKHGERNSDRRLWIKFAQKIGARVIDDYEIDPIPLHQRMMLYANAKMNFGVTNGPMFLLLLTPYPVCIFDCQKDAAAMSKMNGIEVGGQIPIALPHQHTVWEKPTKAVLMREFGRLL
jgi:hypothetical protein